MYDTTQWLRKDPLRHSDQVAMEMATALLVLETGLEQFAQPGSDFTQQGATMVARLAALQRGEASLAEPAPLLGELSRRAQERLLLSQVAREIQASLGQIEQALDTYFRDPARHADLGRLDAPLKQVEGALAMLGEIRAITVLREAGAQIHDFSQLGSLADPQQFESVAHKLSALGFYVEALQHGNANLEALLSPGSKSAAAQEAQAGAAMEDELAQQLRDAQVLAAQLKDKPEDDSLREELKHNLEAIRKDATIVADSALEQHARDALQALASPEEQFDSTATNIQALLASAAAEPAAMPEPSADTTRLAESSNEQIDAELLEIFLQEAHEVLATIGDNMVPARSNPSDREVLTTIRRGFHTLKGSSRMVGLKEFGEAAWGVEQVMNRLLQDDDACASPSLFALIDDARETLLCLGSRNSRQAVRPTATPRLDGPCRTSEGRRRRGNACGRDTCRGHVGSRSRDSDFRLIAVEKAEDDSAVHFAETIVMGESLLAGQSEEFEQPSESEILMPELSFDESLTEETIDLEESAFDVQQLPTLGEEAANEPDVGAFDTSSRNGADRRTGSPCRTCTDIAWRPRDFTRTARNVPHRGARSHRHPETRTGSPARQSCLAAAGAGGACRSYPVGHCQHDRCGADPRPGSGARKRADSTGSRRSCAECRPVGTSQ